MFDEARFPFLAGFPDQVGLADGRRAFSTASASHRDYPGFEARDPGGHAVVEPAGALEKELRITRSQQGHVRGLVARCDRGGARGDGRADGFPFGSRKTAAARGAERDEGTEQEGQVHLHGRLPSAFPVA